MLPIQFYAENIHFALSLFAALVNFAIFWLIFDAWTERKLQKELFKWAGFLAISISFLANAVVVQSISGSTPLSQNIDIVELILRSAGYMLVIIGLLTDPLPQAPKLSALVLGSWLKLLTPFLALSVAALYARRSFTGLENHLKPLALYFVLLFGFELVHLYTIIDTNTHTSLIDFLGFPGPVWIFEQFILLAGLLVAGSWVWQYLTKRIQTQLFMIFVTSIVVIFLITAVFFTSNLMVGITNTSLDNLQKAADVLNYAIGKEKEETLAAAQEFAGKADVTTAVLTADHEALSKLGSKFLGDKNGSLLIITGSDGQVLYRSSDPSKWGESLSSDTMVRRSLLGQSPSSITTKDSVLAPIVFAESSSPIRDGNSHIIGTITFGYAMDNAFLDQLKSVTGLEATLYAGNVRSATTFSSADSKSRYIGIKENDQGVNQAVLHKGIDYKNTIQILNNSYLAEYTPLKDNDNSIVGMLFVGEPESDIYQQASQSLSITSLLTIILLALSIIPAYFISKYLVYQLS